MESFIKDLQVRWSDLDPNFHMLHSRYYDLGAEARIDLFMQTGITIVRLKELQIGPILFREECRFLREITFGDQLSVQVFLTKCRKDGSRFSMMNQIIKNGEILAAEITVDVAWMDLTRRKLAIPPAEFMEAIRQWPKADEFEWTSGT